MISLLVFLGYLGALAGFALAFLSQRYWFARAWRLAGRSGNPLWRKSLRGVLIAGLAAIAAVGAATLLRHLRGGLFRSSWWTPVLALWLSSSIVSYSFIKVIAFAESIWKRIRRDPEDVATVEPRVPLALAGIGVPVEPVKHSRRYFFQAAGLIAGVVPFAGAAYGFAAERFRYNVREVAIPIANLPAALDGLRIAQLSDIHIGSYMPASEVRRAVDMANELKGDLTVVTGDFVTGIWDPLEDCIAELSRLRAPLGVWGCNGNHEVYAEAEEKSKELFQKYGMRLLRQENAELRWNGSALNLIGVDYQRQRDGRRTHTRMLRDLEPLVRRDVPNILLSHNPNSFPRAAELGIELSLAGHTHGGQVKVEILDRQWSPAEFLTPYVAGLYERPLFASSNLDDDEIGSLPQISNVQPPTSRIYVNRGLGTIGAPVRLGVPPEITLITLKRSV